VSTAVVVRYRCGMNTIVTRPEVETDRTDTGEPTFSHYVPRDEIMRAMVEGVPVTALCGKTWIPSRDPQKYPVCPVCQELMAHVEDMFGSGEGDGS